MSSTIAVLGASVVRSKFGNKCVRAYLEAEWTVLPVNPRADEIEGLAVSRTLADARVAAGGQLDRIAVYLPPAITGRLLPEIADADATDVFFNPGSADPVGLEEARELGIAVRDACAIVDIGLSPAQFP